ncbi:CYTH domain-containing protein [Robertmurraya sp. Marseille-Q9965]
MSQNIEIEFKNLLTETEFMQLKSYLDIDNSMFIKQDNHYFDTTNFSLKELGCALRIRFKNGRYELTLKEPHPEGLLETNQTITEQEATEMIDNNVIIDGPVKARLVDHQIPYKELVLFGTLSTERAEQDFQGGLIVLDYSTYLNHFDYELEYEVHDYQKGKVIFENLLSQLNIPIRTTENKIRRFYQAKFNQK